MLLPFLTEQNVTVDRLPVLITRGNVEQLLGVQQVKAGPGRQQAIAVYELLNNWHLTGKVSCCDKTESNSGRINSACILLEQLLERDLLYLPCRHHILEIILRSIFDEKQSLFHHKIITKKEEQKQNLLQVP